VCACVCPVWNHSIFHVHDILGVKKEEEKEDEEPSPIEVKQEPKDSESSDITNDKVKTETDEKLFHLSDFVKEEVERLMKENKRLQNLSTEMHQKHHETMLKVIDLLELSITTSNGIPLNCVR